MTKNGPILALFVVICWFMVSSYQHKLNISHSVTKQVLLWSQHLPPPSQTQKITELIKMEPLVNYVSFSESVLPISMLQFLVPVTQYGIPLGYHRIELDWAKFLRSSFMLQRFWIGNIIMLLALIIGRFFQRLKKSDNLISAQDFRTKTIAHDLKSPLTLLKALTHLNTETTNPDEIKQYLQQLETRFIKILDQIQADDHKIPFTEIKDLKKTIEDLINQIELSGNQSIALHWNISESLNYQLINCSSSTLLRLIQNVLTNAVEANVIRQQTQIDIDASIKNGFLCIDIMDFGPGLNQLLNGQSTKGEGRGLGLKYIEKTLHKSPHHWSIKNKNSSNGCIFTFEFSLLNLPPAQFDLLASCGFEFGSKWPFSWPQIFSTLKFWT